MSNYCISPSGGEFHHPSEDRYCVHLRGSCHNVIKHVPYAVAEALVAALNAAPSSYTPLVDYFIEKLGHPSARGSQ